MPEGFLKINFCSWWCYGYLLNIQSTETYSPFKTKQKTNQTSKQTRNLTLISFFVEYVKKWIYSLKNTCIIYVRLALLVTVTLFRIMYFLAKLFSCVFQYSHFLDFFLGFSLKIVCRFLIAKPTRGRDQRNTGFAKCDKCPASGNGQYLICRRKAKKPLNTFSQSCKRSQRTNAWKPSSKYMTLLEHNPTNVITPLHSPMSSFSHQSNVFFSV